MTQNDCIHRTETFPHSSVSFSLPNEPDQDVKEVTTKTEDSDRQRLIHNPVNLSYEWIRRSTFDSWPVPYINIDELAKNGFFYLHQNDLVQCYFCKGVIGYWEQGDRPDLEHKKHYPGCPFVLGQPTSNVPINSPKEEEKKLFWFLNEYLQKSLETHPPSLPENVIETDSISLGRKSVSAYPSFASLDSRRYSFTNTSQMKWPSTEKLAQAGFFYTGISDYVLCYECGGGLFNWRETDEPLEDHRLYYGSCPLVSVHEEDKRTRTGSPIPISDEQEQVLLHYSFVGKLIETGFPQSWIKKALKEYLERHYYLPQTFSQCLNAVRDWEYKQNQINHSKSKEEEQPSTKNEHISEERPTNEIRSIQGQDTAHEGLLQWVSEKRKSEVKRAKYRGIQHQFLDSPGHCYHECEMWAPTLYQCPKCRRLMMQTLYPVVPQSVRLFHHQSKPSVHE